MPENDHVTRGKRDYFEDDSSQALGLDHRIDAKGRMIVTLPPADAPGYDRKMVGMSPDAIIQYLKRKQEARESNNIDQLMREVPGGYTPGAAHGSSNSKRRRKRSSARTRASERPFDDEIAVTRPHMLSGRVSFSAKHGFETQRVKPGEMLNLIGETLSDGVSWEQIKYQLRALAGRKLAGGQ